MPPKPSAAAARNVSTGKVEFSSQSFACGIISLRANARAGSCIARCSSERPKSMLSVATSTCRQASFHSFTNPHPKRNQWRSQCHKNKLHKILADNGRAQGKFPVKSDYHKDHGIYKLTDQNAHPSSKSDRISSYETSIFQS